jgi:hypothetical protein
MSGYQYKYWHTFTCGHTQRSNNYRTWEWMKLQALCKTCNEVHNMAEVQATTKPPIGLRPASAWNSEVRRQRAVEITQAMQRYAVEGAEIPALWFTELKHQLKMINESQPTAEQ